MMSGLAQAGKQLRRNSAADSIPRDAVNPNTPDASCPSFPAIAAEIQVSFSHRVLFTRNAFGVSNKVVRTVLNRSAAQAPQKVIVIADRPIMQSRPCWVDEIRSYFAANADALDLVSPPI